MTHYADKIVGKMYQAGGEVLKRNEWFRCAANRFKGKGFKGISLGDTKRKFFRPGWETVDIVDADSICDLRKDALPFLDESFHAAHASHLVEHIADPARLFDEVYRSLKSGGVFRVSTPDLDLLTTKYKENDWGWFLRADGALILDRISKGQLSPESLLIHNRLVGWLASYSGRLDTAGGPIVEKDLVDANLAGMSKYEFRDWCVSLLKPNRVYAHVHVYDFDELADILKRHGFTKVIRKEFGLSDCAQMTCPPIDRERHKAYSMYVEATKI